MNGYSQVESYREVNRCVIISPDFESGRNGATPMLYDTVAVRGIAKNGPIAKYNAIKNANEKIG